MTFKIIPRLSPFLLVAILLLPASELALAQSSAQGSVEAPAIRDVIAGQLDAFGRSDGPGAFAFASPTIRTKFQTPEIFMDMVRRHYAPVYRPSEISFQGLHASPRGPVQEVLLVGPDGPSGHRALFHAAAAGRQLEDQRRAIGQGARPGLLNVNGLWPGRADPRLAPALQDP